MHPYGWDDKNCPDWEGSTDPFNSRDIFWLKPGEGG
jgi:hypothetical protein